MFARWDKYSSWYYLFLKSDFKQAISFKINDFPPLFYLNRARLYDIQIKFEDINAIRYSFDISLEKIKDVSSTRGWGDLT